MCEQYHWKCISVYVDVPLSVTLPFTATEYLTLLLRRFLLIRMNSLYNYVNDTKTAISEILAFIFTFNYLMTSVAQRPFFFF